MWYDQIFTFLGTNWKFIVGVFLFLYVIRCVREHKDCRAWVSAQIEWLKMFFVEDKVPHAPSHKNLIGLALTAMFCIAYIKTLVYQTTAEVPDIPQIWAMTLLGLLGIRALQSAAETKFNNGNGNGFDAKAEIAKLKEQMGIVEPPPGT